VCNLAAQHAFAGSSFWVRDAKSGWFLYHKLVYIVGGMLLPLEVLPDALERFARLTPFAAMAYAPARIASGHLEPHLLAEQLGWTVAAVLLALATFRAGEARLAGAAG
jgi:ABC-2 type transport system permease protein